MHIISQENIVNSNFRKVGTVDFILWIWQRVAIL